MLGVGHDPRVLLGLELRILGDDTVALQQLPAPAHEVDELRDGTFIGSVFVRANGRVFKLDARPSDAIALAIGAKVPIYVAEDVLSEVWAE